MDEVKLFIDTGIYSESVLHICICAPWRRTFQLASLVGSAFIWNLHTKSLPLLKIGLQKFYGNFFFHFLFLVPHAWMIQIDAIWIAIMCRFFKRSITYLNCDGRFVLPTQFQFIFIINFDRIFGSTRIVSNLEWCWRMSGFHLTWLPRFGSQEMDT